MIDWTLQKMKDTRRTTKDSHLTLILLSDWADTRYTLRIPKVLLLVLAAIVVAGSMAGVALSLRYTHNEARARYASQLTHKLEHQEQMLDDLERQVDQMEAELNRLAELDRQVRATLEADFSEEYQSIILDGSENLAQQEQVAAKGLQSGPESVGTSSGVDSAEDGSGTSARIAQQEARLNRMLAEGQIRVDSYRDLRSLLGGRISEDETVPHIWPVKGGYVTSNYGYRVSPVTGRWKFHRGLDLGAPEGTPIVATGAGVVTFVGRRAYYGKVVEIRHTDSITTLYAHASDVLVEVGEHVSAGELIALVGSTGRATGPHIHYEVRQDGQPINPWGYLPR